MIVVFRRTGQRRYSVEAQRLGFPNVVMHPAPGYDRLIPHDLMHLVVEAQLGLKHGIYAQLAAGGNAGSFRVNDDESSRGVTRRVRRQVTKRGKRLLRGSRDELLQSERATYICWQAWLARSSSPEQRKQSQTMTQIAEHVQGTTGVRELQALNEAKLDKICKHLDHLSSHWSRLEVGQSISVGWPDLTIVTEYFAKPTA